MRAMILLIIHLVLLTLASNTAEAESAVTTLPRCQRSCGTVQIQYPFGIGRNCSMSKSFVVNCKNPPYSNGTPYLQNKLEILSINLSLGQVRLSMPLTSRCYNYTTKELEYFGNWTVDLRRSPYRFNHEKNKFIVIGCDTLAYIRFSNNHDFYLGGCVSGCNSLKSLTNGPCSGIGCCYASIPKGTNYIEIWIDKKFINRSVYNYSSCSYAMITEGDGFVFNNHYITTDQLLFQRMPVVIDWTMATTTCDNAHTNKSSFACISNNSICVNSSSGPGYFCSCSYGYQGNPYLEGGCQDIDECANQNPCSKQGKCHNLPGTYKCSCAFGWRNKHNNLSECILNLKLILGTCAAIVALLVLGLGGYVVHQRIKISKLQQKYFQQHGGHILLEKMQSDQKFGFTIFTKQQIEQATNKFDDANIIGQGGAGTVYRGTLRDQMVAIKKCKIVNERKNKEFGKEMIILSQINHKNILKLLGCCLEVEVPMLVYEFIQNGTLFDYIHGKTQRSHIPLSIRLRIAHELAEALAYLHFSASPPIIHGDVKSLNILLDDNYIVKVSDFGASVLSPKDEAQFVTHVQGTCGYLDPEYLQSCRLTNKSDVYSFGVVLLELLCRRPIIDFDAPEEERSLSSCFLSAVRQKRMQEFLNAEIGHEDDMNVIMETAELVKECLKMKGEERPTMVEVTEELARIRKLNRHSSEQERHDQEIETEHSGSFNPDIETL